MMTYFLLALKITVLVLLSKVVFKKIKEQQPNRLLTGIACSLSVSTLFVVFASKPLGFGLPTAISLVSAMITTLLTSFYFYNKALKASNVNHI